MMIRVTRFEGDGTRYMYTYANKDETLYNGKHIMHEITNKVILDPIDRLYIPSGGRIEIEAI